MKKIYLFLMVPLFCSNASSAQITLTKSSHEPVVGDVSNMVKHDSTAAVPKSIGIGQIWNFSTFTANSYTEASNYLTVASTPGASLFPSAGLAQKRGTDNYDYYNNSGSTWEFVGQFKTGTSEKMILSNTAVFSSWPISLGSSNTDLAVGTQTDGSGTSTLNATISYTATGTGTVIMPGGVTHNNCLQVIQTLSLVTTNGTSTSTNVQITYDYYVASKKFPIVEVQYETEYSGSNVTKKAEARLNADGLVVGLEKEKIDPSAINLFPNPCIHVVNVRLGDRSSVQTVKVSDLMGKVVLMQTGGTQIDVSSLESSYYFVEIQTETAVFRKPLVVSKN